MNPNEKKLQKEITCWFSESSKVNPGPKTRFPAIPRANIFTIPNFLTPEECQYYLEATEKAGYEDINWEYHRNYRDCHRLTTKAPELSSVMWSRLEPFLEPSDLHGVRPYGINLDGKWVPIGINPCLRFTRYSEAQHHFSAHRDGKFVLTDHQQSIYTVMIYLSDGFLGGETVFIEKQADESKSRYQKNENAIRLTPTVGMAVIFNHDVWHFANGINQVSRDWRLREEAEYLAQLAREKVIADKKLKKYILRTDLMFQLLDDFYLSPSKELGEDPTYQECQRLYFLSIDLQKAGDPEGSTEAYLEAQALQLKLPSIPDRSTYGPEKDWLDSDLLVRISHHLDPLSVARAQEASRAFRLKFSDNRIWMNKYAENWPVQKNNLFNHRAIASLTDEEEVEFPSDDESLESVVESLPGVDASDPRVKNLVRKLQTRKILRVKYGYNSERLVYHLERDNQITPTLNSLNWKMAYKYRLEADQQFRPVVIYISPETVSLKRWDVVPFWFPAVISQVCGHYWCEGSGEENCLIGFEAKKRAGTEDSMDYYGPLETLFPKLLDDDSVYGEWRENGSSRPKETKMNWRVIRCIFKRCLELEDRRLSAEDVNDEYDHWFRWEKRTAKNPVVLIRSPFMTEDDLNSIRDLLFKELYVPYFWVIDDVNQLEMISEPTRLELSATINRHQTDESEVSNSELCRVLETIWEVAQLPESKDNFESNSVDLTGRDLF